jgi:hypothetical protein
MELVTISLYCRAYKRLYKTGFGLTTGFNGSQSVTQIGYSVLHFITHNNWVSSLPLKTSDPALQPLLQPTLMASLAITILVTRRNSVPYSLTAGWCPSYIARERTTKKTRPSHCCLGTDPVENAAFPLFRSRLGSNHIENMSRGVCLATVVNTCHNIFKVNYSWDDYTWRSNTLFVYALQIYVDEIKNRFIIMKIAVFRDGRHVVW